MGNLAIEEGYLVSGALIPLIMPPDIPLLWLTVAVIFAVVIGKEAFGGTGMNILNIALLARAFIFFAYPTEMAGDTMANGKEVWVAGFEYASMADKTQLSQYGWSHGFFDWIFNGLGWRTFGEGGVAIADSWTDSIDDSAAREDWGWQPNYDLMKMTEDMILHLKEQYQKT